MSCQNSVYRHLAVAVPTYFNRFAEATGLLEPRKQRVGHVAKMKNSPPKAQSCSIIFSRYLPITLYYLYCHTLCVLTARWLICIVLSAMCTSGSSVWASRETGYGFEPVWSSVWSCLKYCIVSLYLILSLLASEYIADWPSACYMGAHPNRLV